MGIISWSDDAIEDLHRIADPSVIAEIMDLAERELTAVTEGSVLQGRVGGFSDLFWRRSVRLKDLSGFTGYSLGDEDEFGCQACDYVLVYRRATRDEMLKFQFYRPRYVIARVLHNRDFAHLARIGAT